VVNSANYKEYSQIGKDIFKFIEQTICAEDDKIDCYANQVKAYTIEYEQQNQKQGI
jgi:hypothetical protein